MHDREWVLAHQDELADKFEQWESGRPILLESEAFRRLTEALARAGESNARLAAALSRPRQFEWLDDA